MAAGGYNGQGVVISTEILNITTLQWQKLVNPSSSNNVNVHQLNFGGAYQRRSLVPFVDIDGKLKMIGGLACGKTIYNLKAILPGSAMKILMN